MDKSRAIELLKQALTEVPHLKELHHNNQEFKLWKAKVLDIIEAGLDADDVARFLSGLIIHVVDGWTSDGVHQKYYLENLENYETALKSIIQKYEIIGEDVVPAEGGGNKKAELEQFHDGLIRYKQLVVAKQKGSLMSKQETEFQELSLKLQRLYGSLQTVIEEYDGHAVVFLSGREYEAFNSAFSYTAFSPEALEVVMDTAIAAVNTAIGKLGKVLESNQLPREAIYPSGTPYNAYKDIRDRLTAATRKLIIVDPYVDSTLFNMLENVQPKVQIQILTRNMKGDFQLTGQKFKEQREKAQQGTLEIRKSEKFHDRFIVADEKAFQIGASLKDAGTKMCAMNEFKGSDIKSMLKKIISGYWDEAEIVL